MSDAAATAPVSAVDRGTGGELGAAEVTAGNSDGGEGAAVAIKADAIAVRPLTTPAFL